MPASERSPASSEPDIVDLAALTPAMQKLHSTGAASEDLKRLNETLGDLIDDLCEIAFVERHRMTDILAVQNKPFSSRAKLIRAMGKRGLDTSVGWRQRLSQPVEPHALPPYLDDIPEDELAQLRDTIADLQYRLESITRRREQQYPEMHEQLQASAGQLGETG